MSLPLPRSALWAALLSSLLALGCARRAPYVEPDSAGGPLVEPDMGIEDPPGEPGVQPGNPPEPDAPDAGTALPPVQPEDTVIDAPPAPAPPGSGLG